MENDFAVDRRTISYDPFFDATSNEAAIIGRTIRAVLRPGVEVIVADAESADGTREIAGASGALVIEAPPGRGSPLNAGAARARGTVLLFLHADTLLPRLPR
jgi:glycosyltransferase involved in cell wall biosynthesis